MKLHQNKDIFEFLCYSGNKIRKTQNEHLNFDCQNLIGLYRLVFDLETIGKFRILDFFFVKTWEALEIENCEDI